MLSRRALLTGGAALLGAAETRKLKIGVMDGVLRMSSNPLACAAAKRLGLEGVQVTLGRREDGKLRLADAELQEQWTAASRENSIPLDATYLDVLHSDCFKIESSAARDRIRSGIEITRKLNASILMTVFFGKCAIESAAEFDTVARLFRELAPEAERAGVILGFENLLSGDDNLRMLDRVASSAFRIYYDVGNSTRQGYDVPAEIRRLGRKRICQFHFKDEGYLGSGPVRFPDILSVIRDIGFEGYANLETSSPSGDIEKDVSRNLAYLRGL